MTTLTERLRQAAALLPDGATINLPVSVLRELETVNATPVLEVSTDGKTAHELTVADIAARTNRAHSTVRGWFDRGEIEGGYRFMGREWRVSAENFEAFMRKQATNEDEAAKNAVQFKSGDADLGSWRKLRKQGLKKAS